MNAYFLLLSFNFFSDHDTYLILFIPVTFCLLTNSLGSYLYWIHDSSDIDILRIQG